MLKITNYTKKYDKRKIAVDNLSLTIEKGDLFAFIGHNGAGKSTTIKSIAGILPFEEGEILIDGVSIVKDPVKCKQMIAYIPDNPDLYEHLTCIEYINFVCNVYNANEGKDDLVHKYAAMFNIEKDLGSPIKSYSHGMKQKVALIAALAHKPKLLILDEPFVGLDPKASHDLKLVMKELCDNGTMIFFSSHVLEVVEKLCNKIAIIKNGKIVASGNVDDVIGNSSLEKTFLELYNE